MTAEVSIASARRIFAHRITRQSRHLADLRSRLREIRSSEASFATAATSTKSSATPTTADSPRDPAMVKQCDHCGKAGGAELKLRVCSACKEVRYCSTSCQKAAWPQHKAACKRRRELNRRMRPVGVMDRSGQIVRPPKGRKVPDARKVVEVQEPLADRVQVVDTVEPKEEVVQQKQSTQKSGWDDIFDFWDEAQEKFEQQGRDAQEAEEVAERLALETEARQFLEELEAEPVQEPVEPVKQPVVKEPVKEPAKEEEAAAPLPKVADVVERDPSASKPAPAPVQPKKPKRISKFKAARLARQGHS